MKIVQLKQGTDAWRDWRKSGLGGSDVATIMGVAPFEDATVENLVREKVEGWERATNFAMRRGTRYEDTARTLYECKQMCTAPAVCVEHDEFPWARVSLDGLCERLYHPTPEPWILELKVPNWQSHSLALAGVVPDYYWPQCQWQLFVTGLTRLDYASWSNHRRFSEKDYLAIVPVEADLDYQGKLVVECAAFWFKIEELRQKQRDERRERAAIGNQQAERVEAEFA